LKLIVNTNIVFRALIKGSRVRAILLNPNHQFYIPDHAMGEVEKHLHLIIQKTGLAEEEIRLALSLLLTNIQIIPSENILAKWNEAEEIIGSIDEDDIPFMAASLSITCDGIWSDDKDLTKQRKVKVWSTEEMMSIL